MDSLSQQQRERRTAWRLNQPMTALVNPTSHHLVKLFCTKSGSLDLVTFSCTRRDKEALRRRSGSHLVLFFTHGLFPSAHPSCKSPANRPQPGCRVLAQEDSGRCPPFGLQAMISPRRLLVQTREKRVAEFTQTPRVGRAHASRRRSRYQVSGSQFLQRLPLV